VRTLPDDRWTRYTLELLERLSRLCPGDLNRVQTLLAKKWIPRNQSHKPDVTIGLDWVQKELNIITDLRELIAEMEAEKRAAGGGQQEGDEQQEDRLRDEEEEFEMVDHPTEQEGTSETRPDAQAQTTQPEKGYMERRRQLIDEICQCWGIEEGDFTTLVPQTIQKHMDNPTEPFKWSTNILSQLLGIAKLKEKIPELQPHQATLEIHDGWKRRTKNHREKKDLQPSDTSFAWNQLRKSIPEDDDSSDSDNLAVTGGRKRSPTPDSDADDDLLAGSGSKKRKTDISPDARSTHEDAATSEQPDNGQQDATGGTIVPQQHRTLAPGAVKTDNLGMKRAIEEYWGFPKKCKDAIPVDMQPTGQPESWGGGNMLKELYNLARITYKRHGEVAVMLRHFMNERKGGKALGFTEIRKAHAFFNVDGPPAVVDPTTQRQTRSNATHPPKTQAGPSSQTGEVTQNPLLAPGSAPPRRQPSNSRPNTAAGPSTANPRPSTSSTTTLATLMSHPTASTILAITSTTPLGTQLSALSNQIQAADNEVRIAESELAALRSRRARVNSYMVNGHPLVVQEEISEKEAEVERKKREVLRLRGEVVERVRGREV